MSDRFRHRLRVRFNECDPQGIVFNANYFTYFDIAVTELWRAAIGSYSQLLEHGADMVVAEASARYRAPARFDEEIAVEFAEIRLGGSSIVQLIEVRKDGDLLVEGSLRHVAVDARTLAKTGIPDAARAGLRDLAARHPGTLLVDSAVEAAR